MNIYQRIVLVATALILVAMLLFPPYMSTALKNYNATFNEGYTFILRPPNYDDSTYDKINMPINVSLLILQYLYVSTIGGMLYFALKTKQSH
jgi:hypothetical protein